MFTTDRLILRAAQQSDAEFSEPNAGILFSLRNDLPTLLHVTLSPSKPFGSTYFKDKFIPMLESKFFHAIIVLKSNPFQAIGFIILDLPEGGEGVKNRDVDLGMMLAPKYQGKGYGTEVLRWVVDWAFKIAGMHRISIRMFEGNDAALHVYKKIGFVVEGAWRKANWINGEWKDVILLGMVSSEWKEHVVDVPERPMSEKKKAPDQ